MNELLKNIILQGTESKEIIHTELVQSLWSGYGEILRCKLSGSEINSVILKHVQLNQEGLHPRGWNSDLSHRRKLHSYQVETAWYRDWNHRVSEQSRIPRVYALENLNGETVMLLEDLNSSGFPLRKNSVNDREIKACISWLAAFHGTFLGVKPQGLWEQGTYWHLETRPDELEALKDLDLKHYASAIDKEIRSSPYQTLVHGDAKLANFCFSTDGEKAAAVDFQYVGGGNAMKDLAYFIGSCLYEEQCEVQEKSLLDFYFSELNHFLRGLGKKQSPKQQLVKFEDLEKDWRRLYPFAWTDFHRFIKGWSPGHWKIHGYSEKISRSVIEELKSRVNK